MAQWRLMAMDQRSCGALTLLLGAHCSTIASNDTRDALVETQWALDLIRLLINLEDDVELNDLVELLGRMMSRRKGIAKLGYRQESRRLYWPRDLAWIEAQSKLGRLADVSPPAPTTGGGGD